MVVREGEGEGWCNTSAQHSCASLQLEATLAARTHGCGENSCASSVGVLPATPTGCSRCSCGLAVSLGRALMHQGRPDDTGEGLLHLLQPRAPRNGVGVYVGMHAPSLVPNQVPRLLQDQVAMCMLNTGKHVPTCGPVCAPCAEASAAAAVAWQCDLGST